MVDSSEAVINILKGAGIIFAGRMLSRGLGLIGEILVARTLLPDQFGVVALAYTVVSTVGLFTTFGTKKGVPRLISGDEPVSRQQQIILSAFVIVLPISLITLCVLVLFPSVLNNLFGNVDIAPILPIFGLYLLTFPGAQILTGGLRGLEQASLTVLAQNGGRLFGLALFAVAVLVGVNTIGAVGYYVVTQLGIACLAAYFLYKRLFDGSTQFNLPQYKHVRQTFSFSWPLAISSSFLILMGNLDILMIGYFLESAQVGYYRAIQPLAMVVIIFLSSFVFLFMPIATKYYKRGSDDIVGELFSSTTKLVTIISFPVTLVFVLFANDVVVAFYGDAYTPAALTFTILVIGTYLRVFVGPNAAMIEAIGRTRVDLLSSVGGMLTNVVLNAVLIPRYGIPGAAVATSCGYLVYNLLELGVVYHSVGIHPFSINMFKPLIPTAIFAGVLSRVTAGFRLSIVALLGIGIVIALVQLLAVFATRSLDQTDVFLLGRIEERLGIEIPFLEWAMGHNSKEKDL
ncbi:flippase [Haloterrigena salifodinae]|uniref:Flippase n=1 Tax=Haloterrigena salifodinae TaxID=2675099 RepID=A0A8T8E2L4_9EURY|nr:flippase [Haloterrigena salifodinae]QRV15793.1 flippase [Haloterrigena salifodinae]